MEIHSPKELIANEIYSSSIVVQGFYITTLLVLCSPRFPELNILSPGNPTLS